MPLPMPLLRSRGARSRRNSPGQLGAGAPFRFQAKLFEMPTRGAWAPRAASTKEARLWRKCQLSLMERHRLNPNQRVRPPVMMGRLQRPDRAPPLVCSSGRIRRKYRNVLYSGLLHQCAPIQACQGSQLPWNRSPALPLRLPTGWWGCGNRRGASFTEPRLPPL